MCTFNLTLSDAIIEQARPAFPSRDAMVEYAQQQLESIFKKLVRQHNLGQNVRSIEELSPEIQEMLSLTAPLKGTVPEWDMNGDIARTEALKEKYGC